MAYFNVFSMHELATKLEISQQAISKWKKQLYYGNKKKDVESLEFIMKYL